MKGFGVHTSLWSIDWTRDAAEYAIAEAQKHPIDFIEIALLDPPSVDAPHTAALLDKAEMTAVCSLGLPEEAWPSRDPEAGIAYLKMALDKTAECGAIAFTGVTFGGIGERTGHPPTEAEQDDVARALKVAADYAKSKGLAFGIEAVNRYENHILNTGWQTRDMIEKVGSDNLFAHLDTYHMNIEEKGLANGILDCREHLRYIHLSESDRGVPGAGTIGWNEVFAALAAIGYKGGMAMESFINLPPRIGSALSVWRPVADSAEQVMAEGLPFLRNMAHQYRLI
ncbi:sugar phosphate isomerase/epimerase [Acuticoccus sp. MNP-M23]|uniref:sugar phosphate isomerase/epimerase family protein n=1 Tax=Acuticoccus sp. MNP-M23 TaxID=3072793 RepID=UPI002814D9A8|nr:sugar phosphate isomerase/epimerase [Acuticoccus sp. MNP-M23]WMS42390.1 sugar phosphate isomerase/epimerase [Acuticoccus sp. MNP-M23]